MAVNGAGEADHDDLKQNGDDIVRREVYWYKECDMVRHRRWTEIGDGWEVEKT